MSEDRNSGYVMGPNGPILHVRVPGRDLVAEEEERSAAAGPSLWESGDEDDYSEGAVRERYARMQDPEWVERAIDMGVTEETIERVLRFYRQLLGEEGSGDQFDSSPGLKAIRQRLSGGGRPSDG